MTLNFSNGSGPPMPRNTASGKPPRRNPGEESPAISPTLDGGNPTDANSPATPTAPSGDAATDRWFRQQLRKLYDDVASEPVPDEFLQILSRLKTDKNDTDTSS
jgi:hypothetical protein